MDHHSQETFLIGGETMTVAGVLDNSSNNAEVGNVEGSKEMVASSFPPESSLPPAADDSGDPDHQTLQVMYTQQPPSQEPAQHTLHTVYTQLPAALQEENGEYRQVYLAVPQTGGNSTLGALSETLSEEQQQAFLAMAVPMSSQQLALGESQTLVIRPVGQGGVPGPVPETGSQAVMVSSGGQLLLQQSSQQTQLAVSAAQAYSSSQVTEAGSGTANTVGPQDTCTMMYLQSGVQGIMQPCTSESLSQPTSDRDVISFPSEVENLGETLPLQRDSVGTDPAMHEDPMSNGSPSQSVHQNADSNVEGPDNQRLLDPLQTGSCEDINPKSSVNHQDGQVFSSVKATLSNALLQAIPGSKSVFLGQVEKDCQVLMEQDPDTNTVTVNGDLQHVFLAEEALKELLRFSYSEDSFNITKVVQDKIHASKMLWLKGGHNIVLDGHDATGKHKSDKAVLCDLLKPQYSRSGREVKRRNLDMNPEDLYTAKKVHTDPPRSSSKISSVNANSNRKKRGRPRKAPEKQNGTLQTTDLQNLESNVDTLPETVRPDSNMTPDLDSENEDSFDSNNQARVLGLNQSAEPPVEEQKFNANNIDIKDNIVQSSSDMLAEIAVEIGLTDADGDDPDEVISLKPESEYIALDMVLAGQDDKSKSGNHDGFSEKENIIQEKMKTLKNSEENIHDVKSTKRLITCQSGQRHQVSIGRPKPKKDYEKLAPFKFFCSQCSFKTKRESHFRNHRKLHEEKNMPLLQCSKCDFRTLRLGHLRRHQLSHSNELYRCSQCKYTTDNAKLLSRHYRIKHINAKGAESQNESNIDILSCPRCEYNTTKLHHLQRHIRIHTSVDMVNNDEIGFSNLVTKFTCVHCPYKTSRKEHYSRHMNNVHSDMRPFLCDLCGKAFKRQDALKQHRVVHTEKTQRKYPFHCHICKKGFRSQAHLNEHRTMHSNIRSYLCEVCGASFKTKSVQRKHVLTIHNNPRAFHCSQCSKRFNTKYALRRHVRTHDTPGMRLMQQAMEAIGGSDGQTVQVITTSLGDDLHAVAQHADAMATIDAQQLSTEVVSAAAIEESFEGAGDVTLRTIPQTAYIQQAGEHGEATTAVVYLNLAPFELERVTAQAVNE